jgi:23S rRNA (cytosine1962-C5)-methyltransferase
MASLILKPGREKSLLRRHPWIFSGAVSQVNRNPAPGETVDVRAADGTWLARAAYSPASQIRARVWTFDPDEAVDADFFRRRILSALSLRTTLGLPTASDAFRLIHAESDGIPGLVVDQYGDVLVLQSLTAGSEFWRETLADLLLEATGATMIYERSDADVRELEGLSPRVGALRVAKQSSINHFPLTIPHSPLTTPHSPLTITENGLKFLVDIEKGHKTGFYLDQRDNRKRVGELAAGRDVLNCFCYTGAFSIYAARGGAKSVFSVDASAEALAIGQENAALNGIQSAGVEWLEADVFTALRKFRDQDRAWDLIILDPPKFAPTAAQAEKAARGYKDINRLAFKLLRPGGILVTFSCSGGIDAALFQKIVASAALDAGVDAQIIETLTQGPDHPVSIHFPEGAYLKGLVCVRG